MLIIGCDFHAGFQVLAIFDNRIGVRTEKRLEHPAEAVAFYRRLQEHRQEVRVGIEAGAPCQWFRRLLAECGHELWVGDAARSWQRRGRSACDIMLWPWTSGITTSS